MKYIRTKHSYALFNDTEKHENLLNSMDEKEKANIVSAGEISFSVRGGRINTSCGGSSQTLKVKSNPLEDSSYFTRLLNGEY